MSNIHFNITFLHEDEINHELLKALKGSNSCVFHSQSYVLLEGSILASCFWQIQNTIESGSLKHLLIVDSSKKLKLDIFLNVSMLAFSECQTIIGRQQPINASKNNKLKQINFEVMWRARNLRCEFDDFYGDAVPGNADDLEKRLTNDCHLEGQSTPTESKLKRIKQIEPAGIKLSKQPKKLKRLQKNAAKQEEAKQRCEKAMHLQKQTSFDRLHKEPMDSSLFAKPLELENDSKASLISTQEISSKENGLNDKIPAVLYKHPVSVNRSFNKFFGYMGHCTVLTDTPIIEGSYYTEVTILPSKTLTTNTQVKDLEKLLQMPIRQSIPKLQSSVRVGIAKRSYKLLTPLGGAESYCYNGKDGNLIHNRSVIPDQLPGDSFAIGDVIGVYFHMEPPLPTDKSDKTYNNKNDGSVLTFFKNGTQLATIRDIDQGFYVFGVSLYNWANVEINEGPEFKYLLPKDAKPYSQIRKETLLYKDLKFD